MNYEHQIITWLKQDEMRKKALQSASRIKLKDWCIAAGFVRNLVWDKLHGYSNTTQLKDIDLIYFDSANCGPEKDEEIEKLLRSKSRLPWSVKNQARMHMRNNDIAYKSTVDAMSKWVEVETAIGAKLNCNGDIELVAPFGLEHLFSSTITINPLRLKPQEFNQRIESKNWLKLWPNLKVI